MLQNAARGAQTMSGAAMVNFDRPPINEVVVGKAFVGRPDFLLPYYGRFWDKVRDRYPKTAHAAPIVTQGQSLMQDEFGVLPRVWFLSEDSTRLVQLQQDRLHANWRQTDPSTPYVRFPAVHEEFWRVSSLLDELLSEVGAPPVTDTRLEVSYINIIPAETGVWESPADWGGIFRDFHWDAAPGRVVAAPTKYAMQFESSAFGEAHLVVRIGMATTGGDATKPVVRFELTVSGRATEGLDEREWFGHAHDVIVSSFKDMTTSRMHELWRAS